MATVYQEKEAACAKDEALRNFIDGLSSPTSDVIDETTGESAEGESAGGEGAENGETESSAEDTQPAETEAAE